MKPEALAELLSGLVDGRSTPAAQEQLERILETDAEARAFYMRYIDLEVELGSTVMAPVAAGPKRKIVPLLFKLAGAALLVLGVYWGIVSLNRPTEITHSVRPGGEPWVAGFEDGDTEGWVGRWTGSGLPPGSKGALSSVTVTNAYGVFHEIRAPERWDAGHFTIYEDTHLHFVYRVRDSAWFDIFFATRPLNDRGPESVLHIFRDPSLWSATGVWREAIIPLARFKRKVDDRFTDLPPVPGERPVHFFFSAAENGLDLTIDRIWVTRGGPGKLELKEVN